MEITIRNADWKNNINSNTSGKFSTFNKHFRNPTASGILTQDTHT